MSLRRRKTTAPPSTDKDEYKQIEAFTIEQVMMMTRFEHDLAIFAKIAHLLLGDALVEALRLLSLRRGHRLLGLDAPATTLGAHSERSREDVGRGGTIGGRGARRYLIRGEAYFLFN